MSLFLPKFRFCARVYRVSFLLVFLVWGSSLLVGEELPSQETNPGSQESGARTKKKKINPIQSDWEDQKAVITVTGSRTRKLLKDSVVKTEVITREDINAMGARTVADTLGNVPGIEVRPAEPGQRGETVRLQGLSAQNVLILVDGQRVTGRFNGAIDLTRFKVEEIERIEIIKGASSALYGSDAIAGVINIITREPSTAFQSDFRSLYGSGRQAYYGSGSEFRNSGSVGIKEDFYSTQFTAGWHRGDGYDLTPDASPGPKNNRYQSQKPGYNPYPASVQPLDLVLARRLGVNAQPPLESTTGNAFRDLNVSNRTTFYLSPDTQILLNGFYRYLDQEGVDSSPPRRTFDRRNKTHDFMGAVGLESDYNENIHISLNANYSRFEDTFIYDLRGSDALNKYEGLLNNVYEFRSRMDLSYFDDHTISLGAETLAEDIRSPRIQVDCARNFPNVCVNELLDLPPARDGGTAYRQRNAVFVQDEWKVSRENKITLVPGLRYENDTQFGSQTMPKISLRWDPSKEYIFRASAGLGYRAPNFVELYYNFQNPGAGYRVTGNEDLRPELSRSYNLGGEWEPNRKFWFSYNFFYNSIDNLIGFRRQTDRDPQGLLVFQTSNFLRARTRGIETSLNYKVTSRFTGSIGYTFTDSEDLKTKLPIEGVGFHRVNASLRYFHEVAKAGISIFVVAFGKQPFYCELDGLFCKPEAGTLESRIYEANIDRSGLETFKAGIPLGVQKYCTENNVALCNDEPVFGYRMVNSYTNINLRIFKKIGDHLELFAGVDNLLEEYDLRYNPQRPRFFYFGVNGSFVAEKDPEILSRNTRQ
jgi:outer membrane receptor for ferrienterochelin and colicins